MTRRYELKKRAERQEETRRRIVDAAVELHESLGPGRTTISAIAERAGVERLTVYRHFGSESEIFRACSARYESMHPLPDAARWREIADPWDRLHAGLTELYRYFESTERMTMSVLRDAPAIPALDETMARYDLAFREMHAALVDGFVDAGHAAAAVAVPIRLAIDFRTWQIMVRELGMSLVDAVDYQVQAVRCRAGIS